MSKLLVTTVMLFIFFFNDTATTEIYTLSLHDALPIFKLIKKEKRGFFQHIELYFLFKRKYNSKSQISIGDWRQTRSEEHTSELQSRQYLVCRLLLEKKKNNIHIRNHNRSLYERSDTKR